MDVQEAELNRKQEDVKDLEGDREYFLRQLDARLLHSNKLQVRSLVSVHLSSCSHVPH